jgi:hypothetical protein
MRDANGGYGRAGLKEEILERPGRKLENADLDPRSACMANMDDRTRARCRIPSPESRLKSSMLSMSGAGSSSGSSGLPAILSCSCQRCKVAGGKSEERWEESQKISRGTDAIFTVIYQVVTKKPSGRNLNTVYLALHIAIHSPSDDASHRRRNHHHKHDSLSRDCTPFRKQTS